MARYIVGDVFDVMASLPDGSVDLVLTSPPFLALRSYLPADHPDKHREIGSEPTPGAFIDTMLALTEEWRRLLAPHGSICVELGDTYSGSGGDNHLYEGTNPTRGFNGSAQQGSLPGRKRVIASGWPDAKSLCLIPELYRVALVYGVNPLTGRTTPRWRARNVIRWCLDGDTVVYARTPKGEGPTRLLHLTQNWQPGQWSLWDGQRWTPVLGWSATEADDAIEIQFRNGERISATREHQWPTTRGLVRTRDLVVGDVVDHVQLPEPERTAPAHLPDEDIGWFVGTFLADGSFDSRDRIQIAGHRNESSMRVRRLRALAAAYDGTATEHEVGVGNEGVVVVRSPVLAAVLRRYIGGTSSRNKCLRAAAWRRSNVFLNAVLDGYLLGDGHHDFKNDRWRLGFTDNRWLARDLRVICARLGYSCRIRRLPRAADPRGGQFAGTASFYHRGEIRFRPGPLVKPDSEIVALRASRRRRFFDIGVEGEPHLFALGSGILTHNCRPNPPVGALGDKVRPATSDMVVACTSARRYFDLDAIREPHARDYSSERPSLGTRERDRNGRGRINTAWTQVADPAGAPPLDHWWYDDTFDQDAWHIPTAPYRGSHYATWPPDLLVKPVLAMCPQRVCRVCGKPSERIVDNAHEGHGANAWNRHGTAAAVFHRDVDRPHYSDKTTLGWTDCGHDDWRPGLVLDPFAGSGTTLAVATGHGRDAIGIDLDARNADLARERVGMFLDIEPGEVDVPIREGLL